MRELRIEEQKSISGGTHYQFKDLKTGYLWDFESRVQARRKWNELDKAGHSLTDILTY